MDIDITQLLIGAILSAIIGGVLGLLVNLVLNSAKRFNGWWDVRIRWKKEWGEELGGEPCVEAASKGKALLSSGFGVGKKNVRGLSYWELVIDGEKRADLCVEFVRLQFQRRFFLLKPPLIIFWLRSYLIKFELHARFRKPQAGFVYSSPFHNYVIKISECESDRLIGNVEAEGREVGEFTADKIG